MGTDKRERQKANRRARLEAERKAEQKGDATRKFASFAIIGVLFIGGLYLYSVVSGNDTDDPIETETSEVAAICPEEDGSSERVTSFDAPVPMCIDTSATYVAQITTNKGDITIELDASIAPNTVNNFVSLARYHFYDGVAFHRVIPGFMIQGGDAVGNPAGTGGPGYQFDDELPNEGDYQIGSVAMANSGADTQGSQFFIVTGDAGVALNPAYSLFGQVTEGMETVSAIEETGSGDGTPSEPSLIENIVITEK